MLFGVGLNSLYSVCSFSVEYFNYDREMLTLSDGGEVALDWVMNESTTESTELRPTVVIMPGLVGQYQRSFH